MLTFHVNYLSLSSVSLVPVSASALGVMNPCSRFGVLMCSCRFGVFPHGHCSHMCYCYCFLFRRFLCGHVCAFCDLGIFCALASLRVDIASALSPSGYCSRLCDLVLFATWRLRGKFFAVEFRRMFFVSGSRSLRVLTSY